MSCKEDPRLSDEKRAALFALSGSGENQPIAKLVYETPCEHMQTPFDPCLAHIEVYKYKLISKMAEVMGFPSETHKLVKITPIVEEGKEGSFPPCCLELNFGSKEFFSSGSYMRCLDCAGFRDDQMTQCSDTYTVCVSHKFLVRAAKVYVETIRYFGPRKCNCQSYAYYLLNILGVSTTKLLKDKVVETAAGYIQAKVKELAEQMELERPTCPGDPNPRSTKTKRTKIEPLPIPSTLEQFELDEYDDPIGKRYKTVFLGCSVMTTSVFMTLLAVFLYSLIVKYHVGR